MGRQDIVPVSPCGTLENRHPKADWGLVAARCMRMVI